MAIGTDAGIHFFGTQDSITAGGGTSAVTDGNFSADADSLEWTNDDDAPLAGFVLEFQYPSGTIDAGGVHLYMGLSEIEQVGDDEPLTDSGWPYHYIGTFKTDTGQAATTDTLYTLGHLVELPNLETSQKYKFRFKDDCNVTMTAGWKAWVTPVAVGPHG